MSEWINNAINDKHIQLYKYEEFKNVKKFAQGAFAHIKYADWPCSERKVALKKLRKFNIRKFVEEVN